MNINIKNIYVRIIILAIIIFIILIFANSCSTNNKDNFYVNTIANKINNNTKQIEKSTEQLKKEIKNTNNLIQRTNNLLKRILKCNQWITMGIAPYTFRSVLICPDDNKNLAGIDTKLQQ